MRARRFALVAVLLTSCATGHKANPVRECTGGPVGGPPMKVATAVGVDPGVCDGGFGVHGFAFVDGQTLLLCDARSVGDPPRCSGPTIDARLAEGVPAVPPGTEADVSMDFRNGRRMATSIRPTVQP